ncbi:CRISPR-associated DxTHG motif protein [Klebsiella variicola]|nr:CRISPR-associated DxTHG motif protein [Klebsiella michiganensis]PXI02822.1 hypothetical protein DMQ94_15145 [Klebsiella variicola]
MTGLIKSSFRYMPFIFLQAIN